MSFSTLWREFQQQDYDPNEEPRLSFETVVVTGQRGFNDRDTVWSALDRLGPTTVIHGGARGADRLAEEWCEEVGVRCVRIDADWAALGRSAGPIRNARMLESIENDLEAGVVAFMDEARLGPSLGTRDCIRQAKAKWIRVIDGVALVRGGETDL